MSNNSKTLSNKKVVRLSQDEYLALHKKCRKPIVTENTTELDAGFLLGIQHVLEMLREGWVYEEPY